MQICPFNPTFYRATNIVWFWLIDVPLDTTYVRSDTFYDILM